MLSSLLNKKNLKQFVFVFIIKNILKIPYFQNCEILHSKSHYKLIKIINVSWTVLEAWQPGTYSNPKKLLLKPQCLGHCVSVIRKMKFEQRSFCVEKNCVLQGQHFSFELCGIFCFCAFSLPWGFSVCLDSFDWMDRKIHSWEKCIVLC